MLGWWRSRSQAARVDLYVRASFYSNFALVPVLAGGSIRFDHDGPAAWAAAALTAGHALLCLLLMHAGLNHYLGRRGRPNGLIAAGGASTAAGIALAFALYPDPSPGQPDGPATAILLVLTLSYVTALSPSVQPRVTMAVGTVACAVEFAISAAQGLPDPLAPSVGLAGLILIVVGISRITLWMLGVVWELDRARHVQASLAVAEERLRFARDLHDVVGRSLSVVALKSELAAQLAKRGRGEAVDEMLDVRRIAQDSLAELRAVVGGYRSADLDVELAGARSLLAAAGIECRVLGDSGGLPADVQGTLGWVVREATTNVLRHSEGRTCTITLHRDDGEVVLTMENDGASGGADRVRFGSGLIGLAERIAALGGTVACTHIAGTFRLTARLPQESPA
ncbi:two-component system sensor histidine kinase DesK [Allocatelliglobosispora scoriae]|uniref:Two-component system sensor histidine kinase DesK n=1 Tax=Allocatelliglobosispora scoriae TaxID=643052 RepID=A0A841BLJ1_9ACTN|nr:sensor histidine kinase [Allocatelliglobosispora scoriae]MBB5867731.1 two-component system sensor histidine kinase DesK [Allocatelliglobosispora scoriae]